MGIPISLTWLVVWDVSKGRDRGMWENFASVIRIIMERRMREKAGGNVTLPMN